MLNYPLLHAALLSFIPISELRGGIPYAVAHDISYLTAYIVCVLSNIMVIPALFVFFETLHKPLYRIKPYRILFDKFVLRTRRKAEHRIGKYGYWGVMMFVAIPLPITGAYTGTLAAWVMNLERTKSFWYLACGVMIAGIIVTVVTLSGVEFFQIFLKKGL